MLVIPVPLAPSAPSSPLPKDVPVDQSPAVALSLKYTIDKVISR